MRFGARDYDPEVGRWTTPDAVGFNDTTNLYGYARNDPVNLTDILGLEIEWLDGYKLKDLLNWHKNDPVRFRKLSRTTKNAFFERTGLGSGGKLKDLKTRRMEQLRKLKRFGCAIFFVIEENLRRIPCKVDPNNPQCGPLPPT